MGNLVCVSCRSVCPQGKTSHSNTSGSLNIQAGSGNAPLDTKQTAPGIRPSASHDDKFPHSNSTARDINCVQITIPDRIAATNGNIANGTVATGSATWDVYLSPELQSCVVTGQCKNNDDLTDVEKVAKGIVDVNLFIATQVIYPALERYHQEQKLQLQQQQQQLHHQNHDCSLNDDDDNKPSTLSADDSPSRDNEALVIRVDNGMGIRLVDKVTIY